MKLTETAQRKIAEFKEAAVDFSRDPDLDKLYKLTAKRQALEGYILDLEIKAAERIIENENLSNRHV